ncbi:MAG: IS21 family transposase, partial [Deltaproteobacteria bacterium]|nr:IS21 family transposase [Deltaproteobacteria bacterium]
KNKKLSMRQNHVAGEKLFIDYSGKKPRILDVETGAFTEVELFVATMGASNFTYAEATRTQQSADFFQSHIRAFEYLGGVPALIVPDQLKSGVTTSCIYDPKIQRTYEEMAGHYGTSVMPARPRKPKDKSKVEVAVQIVQRWILACIRNEIFTSLSALNKRIRELVDELNEREMKTYKKSRRALFESLDKPVLQPLPRERFVFADFSIARVPKDYHVVVDHHAYSVPYTLVSEILDVRLAA